MKSYDTLPKNAKNDSWRIQNEILEIIGSSIVAKIVEDVKKINITLYYFNETTDIKMMIKLRLF